MKIINFFKQYKYLIFAFIVVESIIVSMLVYEKNSRIDIYLNEQTKDINIQYKTVYNSFKQASYNIFHIIINKPNIIEIFEKTQFSKTEFEKKSIREELYNYLKKDYDYLTTIGFKQLHFHLKNNESFLRLHKPALFGDDLTDIRYSVKYVNLFKESIDGFEDGVVVPGFRFVFPLFSKEQNYLGSVETSISSKAFLNRIQNNFKGDLDFIMVKDISKHKLEDILKMNNTDEPFTIYSCENGEKRVGTFIPIKDIEKNKTIAYLVAYQDSLYLSELSQIFKVLLLLISLLSVVLFVYIYNLVTTKKTLEKEVENSTKALKDFNEHLEEKIELEIYENIKKEKLLFQQSKMATMGEMLENIAHQWKQPLQAISINADSVKVQSELNMLTPSTIEQNMSYILESTKFLVQTVQDFNNFLKPNKKLEKVSLRNCIEKSLQLVSSTLNHNDIKIILHMSDIEIYLIKGEFTQVLLNIVNNAKDALLENNTNTKKYIFIDTIITNDTVDINITDNAGGIQEEIIPNIFEQYFTTKEIDGTGIGLHMSRKIIQEHMNGTLFVQNVKYEYDDINYIGAKFSISLQINNKDIKCH